MHTQMIRALTLGGLVSGCIGGQVVDDRSYQPLSGVTVGAKPCADCTEYRTETDYYGSFAFDPEAGDPYVGPTGAEAATRFYFRKDGYQSLFVYRTPKWETIEQNGTEKTYYIFDTPMSFGYGDSIIDQDDDGLSNWYEDQIGTDKANPDTDDDGISDGAEIFGSNWVDYQGLGANPLKKDIFVEIDYEEYTDSSGTHSARLSDAVSAKLVDLFGNLDVDNPDGSKGFALHLIHDQKMPKGTNCWRATYDWRNFNPRHQEGGVFRYAWLCFDVNDQAPRHGTAFGKMFYVARDETNADPSDDQTEARQYRWFRTFAHELGHALGLGHGGGDGINCKPNYPSLMNYAYNDRFNGSPNNLRDTQAQFSDGTFAGYPLHEAAVSEAYPFPGLPSSVDLGFLSAYGDRPSSIYRVSQGRVDWNRDADFTANLTNINLRNRGAEECRETETTGVKVLRDYDDAALMAQELGGRVRVNVDRP